MVSPSRVMSSAYAISGIGMPFMAVLPVVCLDNGSSSGSMKVLNRSGDSTEPCSNPTQRGIGSK